MKPLEAVQILLLTQLAKQMMKIGLLDNTPERKVNEFFGKEARLECCYRFMMEKLYINANLIEKISKILTIIFASDKIIYYI